MLLEISLLENVWSCAPLWDSHPEFRALAQRNRFQNRYPKSKPAKSSAQEEVIHSSQQPLALALFRLQYHVSYIRSMHAS